MDGHRLLSSGVTAKGRLLLPAALVACLSLYLALALSSALTKLPTRDEAYFSSPGLDLGTKGVMSTSVLEHAGTWHPGMDRYTYWLPPLHFLATAAWFKAFGFSLVSLRALSILWGVVAVLGWFLLISQLARSNRAALLATGLVSVDYFFLQSASDGRMDMMCHALNVTAMATYLALRERRLSVAITLSQSLVVAAGLTHPNGIIGLAGVAILALCLDHDRIRLRYCLLGIAPYLVGGLGWGLYILQDPALFATQFFGNARVAADAAQAPRLPLLSPLTALKAELDRYLAAFGLNANRPLLNRMKAPILIAYCIGVVGLTVTAIRARDRRRLALVLLTFVAFGLLTLTPSKNWYYLVHITPLAGACLAVWVFGEGSWSRRWRTFSITSLAGLALLQMAGIGYKVSQTEIQRIFVPAVRCVENNSQPGSLIMGDATLFFKLWPQRNVIDDVSLGLTSGRRPAVIVVDPFYRGLWSMSPQLKGHVHNLLAEFDQRCAGPYFDVYARRID